MRTSLPSCGMRPDFTFTAIGSDPLTGETTDPFDGQDDFNQKLLRAVSLETAGRDPLTILRALRFAALYDFAVEPKTAAALHRGLEREGLPRRA